MTVKVQDTFHGQYAYMALANAIEKNPGYVGYLHTNDDVILNPCQLAKFDKSRVWKKIPDREREMHDRAKDPPEDKWSWDLHTQKKMWEDERTFTAEQLQRIANFTGLKVWISERSSTQCVYPD